MPSLDRRALWARLASVLEAEPRLQLGQAWASAQEGDRLAEDLGVDSVGQLYLVLTLVEGLGLAVDDPEPIADGLKTIAQVLDWAEALGVGA